jgi:hypothetical protein
MSPRTVEVSLQTIQPQAYQITLRAARVAIGALAAEILWLFERQWLSRLSYQMHGALAYTFGAKLPGFPIG